MAKGNKGLQGMSFDQIMMQQAIKTVNEPVYCRYCGKNLKDPSSESKFNSTGANTGTYANEWEMRNNAHENCYWKHVRGGRR